MSMIGWFHLKVRLEFDHNVGMLQRDTPSNENNRYMKWDLNPGQRMPNDFNNKEYADFGVKKIVYNDYKYLFGIDKLVITARGRTLVAGRHREWGII